MSVNTNSNTYITFFLVVMVIIVALSLSLVSSGLKPAISKNEEVDKKKKILKSVIFLDEKEEGRVFKPDYVIEKYNSSITESVVDYEGNEIEGVSAFDINVKKEFRKPIEDRQMPVFIYNDEDGSNYYIIPLIGMGLWDEISGYIALEKDMSTIKGAAFDHKGETPGLGAEIAKNKFRGQFAGEQIFNERGDYAFRVLKGSGNQMAIDSENLVDGISGATLTCDGVNNMVEAFMEDYSTFIEKVKSSSK